MTEHPGRIARRAVEIAETQVGVTEHGGNNAGPEVRAYLASVLLPVGQPWCAAFTRWCVEKAAGELALPVPRDYPDSGWCPAIEAWAKARDLWIPAAAACDGEARRGDLALFYFPAKGRVAHVGFVAAIDDRVLETIEGNTGPERSPGVVVREGDGVYRKHRDWSSIGLRGGVARIPF